MAADDAVKNLGLRIARWAGIDVSQRLGEVSRWLTMMCHSTDAADIAAMADQILSEDHPLLPDLVRSLTVSHTRFFRDIEQLDAVETLLRRGPSQMRVWVAGCSTGEEAYSVALLALAQHRKIEIVASDVNQASLDAARAGVYPPEAIERIPRRFLFDFTNRGSYIEVSPRMRQAVRIVHHNLMKPPLRPTDGSGWDIILCRNVLIHFRAEHAAQALDKLALALAPGGHLFLGTSEFHQRTPRLVPVHVANRIALQRPTRMPIAVPTHLTESPTPPPIPTSGQPTTERKTPRTIEAPLSDQQLSSLLLAGSPAEVLRLTRAQLHEKPDRQPALLLAGIAHHLLGHHAEAVQLLERAKAQHPTCWPVLHFLALSLDELGRKADAKHVYFQLQRHPAPTPEAEALIDLLEFGPWYEEACALARHRTRGSLTGFRFTPQHTKHSDGDKVRSR